MLFVLLHKHLRELNQGIITLLIMPNQKEFCVNVNNYFIHSHKPNSDNTLELLLNFLFLTAHTDSISNLISLSWKQILTPETCHVFQHYNFTWSLFHLFWPESLQPPTSSPLLPKSPLCVLHSMAWEPFHIRVTQGYPLVLRIKPKSWPCQAGSTWPFHCFSHLAILFYLEMFVPAAPRAWKLLSPVPLMALVCSDDTSTGCPCHPT